MRFASPNDPNGQSPQGERCPAQIPTPVDRRAAGSRVVKAERPAELEDSPHRACFDTEAPVAITSRDPER